MHPKTRHKEIRQYCSRSVYFRPATLSNIMHIRKKPGHDPIAVENESESASGMHLPYLEVFSSAKRFAAPGK